MTPILLIDDDRELCELLRTYLQGNGFDVSLAHDGETGARLVATGNFQAIVLDIMLPGQDGLATLRQIRQSSAMPVLMLTARGDDIDRIVGLELGADDYLPKPCNPRELVARLRAVLRRTQTSLPGNSELSVGALILRPGARQAIWYDTELALTSTEFDLLQMLASHAGQPVSKATLSEQVLGRPLGRYDRSLDVHVSKLRRKLAEAGHQDEPLQTLRGQGYQWLVTT